MALFLLLLITAGVSAAEAEPRYFGTRPGELPAVKARLLAGDKALRPAREALVSRADALLREDPPAVTQKKKPAPGATLNDYFSQAPYFWPDPAKPDGLPYVARDGKVNPESRTAESDQVRAEKLGDMAGTLALAYYLTGEERYASHAARCLRAWFIEPATRMNPNMNYAQAVPGLNTGRGIGIIEAGGIVEAGAAAGLIAGSPSWPAKDDAALRAWLGEFLDWLRTSKHGLSESAMKQNHGTMYDVYVSRLALILGRNDLAREVLETAKVKRIAVQIEPDGRQPMELKRTKSFNYSRLNLRGLARLATLGEWVGVDLWNYQTPDGRCIRKAVDFMMPYVANPSKEWPYEQIVPIKPAELAPVFRAAAVAYRDTRYEKIIGGFQGVETTTLPLLQPTSEPDKQ